MVLDTSAFLALMEKEDGADIVRECIADAIDGQTVLHGSFVSRTEVEYISIQKRGEAIAEQRLANLELLPIQWHHSDDALCSAAAKLKAAHKISFADAFVAALALRLDATLLHKDPEFVALSEVKQRMLPTKTGTGA